MFEELEARKKPSYEIGQNLETLSVEEIEATIAMLKSEIERLQAAGSAKSAHLNAAEALFGKKG